MAAEELFLLLVEALQHRYGRLSGLAATRRTHMTDAHVELTTLNRLCVTDRQAQWQITLLFIKAWKQACIER